jgi:hypothetical protein
MPALLTVKVDLGIAELIKKLDKSAQKKNRHEPAAVLLGR